LVGVTVALAVAEGTGVLLGVGVPVGLGVILGRTVVALGKTATVSSIAPFPGRLHPPATKVRITPRENPVSTLIKILFLPVNRFMIDTSK